MRDVPIRRFADRITLNAQKFQEKWSFSDALHLDRSHSARRPRTLKGRPKVGDALLGSEVFFNTVEGVLVHVILVAAQGQHLTTSRDVQHIIQELLVAQNWTRFLRLGKI